MLSLPTRSGFRFPALTAAVALACSLALPAAQLSSTAQSVLPQTTRQVISINYHRLGADAAAQQIEDQVLPPEVKGLNDVLVQGGIHPADDLTRLTFATYQSDKGVGIIGLAEGNLAGFQISKFFTKTPKQPNPPQFQGVDIYTAKELTFFVPDASTLVFGSRSAIETAISTEQGVLPKIGGNDQLSDLISGTQSSDVWSVLDAEGSRTMIRSMIGGSTGGIDPSMIDKHFSGARYTLDFQSQIQLNLELMTTDALSAAAISTGLNAALAVRQKQEANPAAKAILGQVQVDSAGDHAFLQVSAPESTLTSLMQTDLFQTILH